MIFEGRNYFPKKIDSLKGRPQKVGVMIFILFYFILFYFILFY